MSLVWIDWFILVFVAIDVWRGLASGFVHQVAQLTGIVVGFMLAVHLMKPVGQAVGNLLQAPDSAILLLGFVVVFISVLLLVGLAAKLLTNLLGALNIGFVNRLFGALLGALKTVLLLSLFLWLGQSLNWPSETVRKQSVFVEPIETVAEVALEYSAQVWPSIDELYEEIGRSVQQQIRRFDHQ